MSTGSIAWFRENKGYGFIHPDDGTDDIFFHAAELVEGEESQLVEGTQVIYSTSSSHRGPKAVKVRIVGAPSEWVEDPQEPAAEEAEVPEPEGWSWQDEISAVVDKHVQAMTDEIKQLIAGWQ